MLLCKTFAGFDKPRPTPTAVLALHFPILTYDTKGLSTPRLTWVDPRHHMHQVYNQDDGTLKYSECLRYDPMEALFTPARSMSNGPIKARNLKSIHTSSSTVLTPSHYLHWNATKLETSQMRCATKQSILSCDLQ